MWTRTNDSRIWDEVFTYAASGQRLDQAYRFVTWGDWSPPRTTTATFQYDQAGREITVGTQITGTDYNANGQITHRSFANGTSVDYTYNNLGWLMDVSVKDSNLAVLLSATYTLTAQQDEQAAISKPPSFICQIAQTCPQLDLWWATGLIPDHFAIRSNNFTGPPL